MQASISNRYYPGLLFRIVYISLLMLTIGWSTSCNKEENAVRDYPRLNTLGVTNIDKSGALFNAEIISGNSADIIEYGFVWSTEEHPDIEWHDKQFKTGAPPSLTFSDTINSALKYNETYYMRAYVKTDNQLIYGKTVTFKSMGSQAPQVTGFTPQSATWGDTIRITGRYFGYNESALQVKMGTVAAQILSSTAETIDMVIPFDKNSEKVRIFVSINGSASMSATDFTYLQPTVTSFRPLTATFDDTLTIQGTNFSLHKSANHIYFNEWPARTVYASRELLKIVVPPYLTVNESVLSISGPATQTAYPIPFTLKNIELISFLPDTVFSDNEILTITGRNFSPMTDINKVFINGIKVGILSISSTTLRVNLPPNIIPNKFANLNISVPVRVEAGQQSVTFADNLVIYWRSKWTRLKDFPGSNCSQGIGFAIGNKGYIGLGTLLHSDVLNSDLWEYNPLADQWIRKAPFPGKTRVYPSSFVIGDIGYVGLGSSRSLTDPNDFLKDFYRYIPSANTWTRIADYPSTARIRSASFVNSDMAYVGAGRTGAGASDVSNEFWSYDPLANQWTASLSYTQPTETVSGFSINNTSYLFYDRKVYQYNTTSWDARGETSASLNAYGFTFTIGNSAYLASSYTLWEYNSENGKISQVFMPPMNLYSVFALNDKAYFVTSDKQVWVFDPAGGN